MKVLILIVLALNMTLYAYVYFSWRKDCKEFGKDQLAVSLGERMKAVFLIVTLPCILAFATRK